MRFMAFSLALLVTSTKCFAIDQIELFNSGPLCQGSSVKRTLPIDPFARQAFLAGLSLRVTSRTVEMALFVENEFANRAYQTLISSEASEHPRVVFASTQIANDDQLKAFSALVHFGHSSPDLYQLVFDPVVTQNLNRFQVVVSKYVTTDVAKVKALMTASDTEFSNAVGGANYRYPVRHRDHRPRHSKCF